MAVVLIIGLCAILLILWLAAPRTVPWVDHLTRLNAGAGSRAEWMAPEQVINDVITDYRAGHEWLESCAANWGRFADGLERYTAGSYLKYQRRALASLVDRKPRLAVSFSAAHTFSVRHFTADGLRCLLVNAQTSRVLTTSSYWGSSIIHTQKLGDTALVFQMLYDMADKRWKIERLIQELPLGVHPGATGAGKKSLVQLTTALPQAAGRDN
jgi:hypothetical protein